MPSFFLTFAINSNSRLTSALTPIASLISIQGQALSDKPPPLQYRCRSRARASLRNRHQALPSWESKTRRNNPPSGLAVRRTAGPSDRGELTSSIVPRGTSFHRSVELEFPPIGCDPVRSSCCCRGWFSGPSELGAVNPYAVQDLGLRPICSSGECENSCQLWMTVPQEVSPGLRIWKRESDGTWSET
jgi:hypothetical protein